MRSQLVCVFGCWRCAQLVHAITADDHPLRAPLVRLAKESHGEREFLLIDDGGAPRLRADVSLQGWYVLTFGDLDPSKRDGSGLKEWRWSSV